MKQVMVMIYGYGSLTVAQLYMFVDTIVRLKGSGAPGLQSCFKGLSFPGTIYLKANFNCKWI